jgi:hypothetical protein
MLWTSVGMLVLSAVTALAQDPPIRVEVQTTESRNVWYTDPVWLAIGGIVLLLIVVLAVVAGRNRSSTTVVR